jgi:hypothetical protein
MVVPISQIQVATPNRYDLGNIKSLADNIAEFGMLHPILVVEASTKDQVPSTSIESPISNLPAEALAKAGPKSEIVFSLVAGYRRLKAAELLGWTEVAVSIISPTDDLKQFDTSLHENFRRKDLNPLEICDLILERKHRWEKLYGPVRKGPQSQPDSSEDEFSSNCAKFNIETAIMLRMSESAVKRFLQLKELDADLRQQIWERKISYMTAITLQSERKKEQKLAKSKKVSIPNLPDKETALALQAEYNRSPVLFQIMMLVGHIYQSMNRFQGKQPEFDNANPDRVVMLIGHIAAISSWLNTLMKEAQETLMQQSISEKSKIQNSNVK